MQSLRGTYLITHPCEGGPVALQAIVAEALDGGVRLVQYRDKGMDQARREAEARALLVVCQAHRVPLLINDDIALAAATGAAGVHLGQDDRQVAEARAALGPDSIVGVTCHADLALARAAADAGASYVAFGRFFPSTSKPAAPPAPLAVLREARCRLNLPLVAIGGITPANGQVLLDAGADMLAVIHGIMGADDPRQASSDYARLFTASPVT